jgi:hypothetical protein
MIMQTSRYTTLLGNFDQPAFSSFPRKRDCEGRDAVANIGAADGPQGEPRMRRVIQCL